MAEEEREFNISPKIEQLQKKLDKDPDSKIFLLLAEEYRKSGMQEEAIAVCQEGLEKHPNYTSARVVLGRAYMELKKMLEAQAEFEEVISKIPDNLVANKFLGDLYFMQGNLNSALERYQVVIRLDPSNEEVASKIKNVSEKLEQQIPIAVRPEKIIDELPSPLFEEDEHAEEPSEEKPEEDEHAEELSEEKIEEYNKHIEELSEEKPEEYDEHLEELTEQEEETPSQITLDLTEEENSIPISEEIPDEPQPQPPQPAPPLQEESPILPPATEEPSALPSEPEIPAIDEEKNELTTATIAELYAKQGLFDKAIKLYNELLEANPDNMELKFRYDQLLDRKKQEETRQKETKGIPPIMDEGEEAIRKKKIDMLNKWLETLKKKRPPQSDSDV
ncbi:MAG: tetratricopeptide repeat protein [Candidatus Aminicenantes bacterium]|nr:tetratricopeptide repeat protein [Candidatus Aminicenantes bacterium]MDH5714697.1 tetratricopeptide repeat protein [Candidatus Aminicenantes bacterium]